MKHPDFSMHGWLVATLLCVCADSRAAVYHVDAVNGRDGATGTSVEIDGARGPFRTLERLEKLPLFPGDQVLLKCGQTFEGPLRITTTSRGGEGNLKLGAYGNCSPSTYPIITGARALGPGEKLASGLMQWKVAQPLGQVFVDGKALPVARYPAKLPYVWPHEAEQRDGIAALKQWLPGKDLAGARAWMRTYEWIMEERLLGQQGRELKMDKPIEFSVRKGSEIYLTGKPWMIASSPGWTYDDSTRLLTLRMPAEGKTVSAAPDDDLVLISGSGGVSISQWRLVDAGGTALRIKTPDAFVQVKDLVIERTGRDAIMVVGAAYAVVDNNLISDVGTNGISFDPVRRAFARGNTLRRIGLWGHLKSALAAINGHLAQKAVFEGNLIERSAYIGIRFSGDAQIRRNIVLQPCQGLSDCGGIYTWRGKPSAVFPPCDVSRNTVIGVGVFEPGQADRIEWNSSIYLDDYTRDVDVIGNVLLDAVQGVYLHNAIRNKLTDNKIIGIRHKDEQIHLAIDNNHQFSSADKLTNEIKDNEFIPKFPRYRLPTGLTATKDAVAVVDAGERKLAIGWADWNMVDWSKVAPRCQPSASSLAAYKGIDPDFQPTAVLLDCLVLKP